MFALRWALTLEHASPVGCMLHRMCPPLTIVQRRFNSLGNPLDFKIVEMVIVFELPQMHCLASSQVLFQTTRAARRLSKVRIVLAGLVHPEEQVEGVLLGSVCESVIVVSPCRREELLGRLISHHRFFRNKLFPFFVRLRAAVLN